MSSFPSSQNGLVYLSPSSFSVSGNYAIFFKMGRSIRVSAPGIIVTGVYVVSATFNGSVTVVTTMGAELPAQMKSIALGTDPDSAPLAESALLQIAFM